MWSSAYQRIIRRHNCRAESVRERSEANINDRVLFEILLYIYIYIYTAGMRLVPVTLLPLY